MSTKVILKKVKFKVRSQKVTNNISYRHAVRHMFSGPFCMQISIVWSFDPMTSSKWTFDGQVNVRKNKVKFPNQYFGIKSTRSVSEFPQDSKYFISFLIRCVELPKALVKNGVMFFPLYIFPL